MTGVQTCALPICTERETWLSLRNLGERVRIVLPEEINTYDVLLSDTVVFSTGTLATTVARLAEEA